MYENEGKRDFVEDDSNYSYSSDRLRKTSNQTTMVVEPLDTPVQLRLPPQSPGSLDRKRLNTSRLDRDVKSRSTIVSRSPQSSRKSHARSLDGVNVVVSSSFSGDGLKKRGDMNRSHEEWKDYNDVEGGDSCCQMNRALCSGGFGCWGNYCGGCLNHHHHPHQHHPHHPHHLLHLQTQFRNVTAYGSCENIGDKTSRKNNFGSQRTLCEGRKKFNWTDGQSRLIYGSNEYLSNHCCPTEREKLYSLRLSLGKVR